MSLVKKIIKNPVTTLGSITGKELFCFNHGVPAWIAYGLGARGAYTQLKENISTKVKTNIAELLYNPQTAEAYDQVINNLDKPVDYATTASLIVAGAVAGHYAQKQLLKIPKVKRGYDRATNYLATQYDSAKNYLMNPEKK